MLLIDTHTHLDSFSDTEVSSILDRARSVGVGAVISAGTTQSTSRRAVELTWKFPGMFAGVGVHPMDLEGPIDDAAYSRLHGHGLVDREGGRHQRDRFGLHGRDARQGSPVPGIP